MKQYTITLDPDTAHRLEIMAARDNQKTDVAIAALLTEIVERYNAKTQAKDIP